MSEELIEIFKLCDSMFLNADIDHNELKRSEIDLNFFNDYQNVRIVNSFLFNFSKLQDKIGAKLFRKVLYEIKEIDSLNIPMIDILNLLERLEIIENQMEWDELREVRNSITHEYPFDIQERVDNIKLALIGYERLQKIYVNLKAKV